MDGILGDIGSEQLEKFTFQQVVPDEPVIELKEVIGSAAVSSLSVDGDPT